MPVPVDPGRWRPHHATAAYRRLRRRILDAAGWRCAECGRAGRLELHHVDGDNRNDRPGNLKPLCRPCHFAAHGRGPGLGAARAEWRAEIQRRLAEQPRTLCDRGEQ